MSCVSVKKTMYHFSLVIFLLLFNHSDLIAQTFAWAKQVGGANVSASTPMQGIKLDGNGNIYCTITFTGTIDADPGPGVFNINSTGNNSFRVKVDSGGNFIWAKEIPGIMSLDAAGNIYTTGTFNGTRDFDPGPGVYNLTS